MKIRDICLHLSFPSSFVIGNGMGQSCQLTAQLQAAVGDRFNFQLSQVPQTRPNMLFKNRVDVSCANGEKNGCDDDWKVLLINPEWGFGFYCAAALVNVGLRLGKWGVFTVRLPRLQSSGGDEA